MGALLLIGLLGVLGGLALGVVVAVTRRPVVRIAVAEHPDVLAVQRTARVWRVAGFVLAVVAAVIVVNRPDGLGLGVAVLPAACGLALVLATAAGELLAPRRLGPVRTAVLERRHLGSVVPRGSAVLAGSGVAVLAGLLTLGWARGSADELDRPGRLLTSSCFGPDGAVTRSSARSPWPGEFYALPLLVALGVLTLVGLLALGLVVRRARPSAEGAGLDRLLRRASARHVLAALGATAWGTAAPVALIMAGALHGLQACPPSWYAAAAVGAVLLGVVSLTLAVWSAVTLVVGPTLAVDDLPRHQVAGTAGTRR